MKFHFPEQGPPVDAKNLRNPAPFPMMGMEALDDKRLFRIVKGIGEWCK